MPREHVGVVGLRRHQQAAFMGHRLERAAAGEQGAAAGARIRLCRRALGLSVGLDSANTIGCRFCAPSSCSTGAVNTPGWADRPISAVGRTCRTASEEIGHGRVRVRERPLVRLEIRAARDHEALAVEQPALLPRGREVHALALHRRGDQAGDASGRGSGAEEQDALVGQLLALHAAGAEQRRDDDGGRALDVVVERAQPVAIAAEQRERVLGGEVLPLQQHFGPALAARR
jgi:hypothetical protein